MVAEAREYGEVFTREWVVDLILDLAGYTSDKDLARLVLVEPSIGSGAFIGPVASRLVEAKAKHEPDADWSDLADAIRGWDLQEANVKASRAVAVARLTAGGCPAATARALADAWLTCGDFLLLGDQKPVTADFVVGNPPYIRIEDIAPELLAAYRDACPTMIGRSDIFIGFYEHALDLLAEGGRLGFICADRWMRNQYGEALRKKIVDGYAVDSVIVCHDADAFESEVSAYPAITVLRRGKQGKAITAEAKAEFGEKEAREFSAWAASRKARLDSPAITATRRPGWHTTAANWPTGSAETQKWLEGLASTLPLLEDTGVQIGIGVATGKDAVYIASKGQQPDVEPERLLPLVHADDVRSGTFTWTGKRLVNPWSADGLVPLPAWPRLAAYLDAHAGDIRARHVAKKNAENWYRTIDRVNYWVLKCPMLVLEDMKAEANPVLVPAGYYPHHNLYFIVSDTWDMEVLGGLLLSKVLEAQVAAVCVRMRGGTLRFQAQYLRQVRCPRQADIPGPIQAALRDAFRTRDRAAATTAALRAFGMSELPT